MPTTHFIVHDKADNVGVVVVEDVKPGQKLTGWVMEGDGTIVVKALVRSTICTLSRALIWSLNHFISAMPWAPPVTTRKCCGPRRMMVRSDLNPPDWESTGV